MSVKRGFAVWITGAPASGKSTITRVLMQKLEERHIRAIVLESDEMREILTPDADYSAGERDAFYRSLALIGEMITRSGVNVVFDATANKQAYRDRARALIPQFLEVSVQCPLSVCMSRDPKGIYRRASAGAATTVPGVQAPYEPPAHPEVVLDCRLSPEGESDKIITGLTQLRFI